MESFGLFDLLKTLSSLNALSPTPSSDGQSASPPPRAETPPPAQAPAEASEPPQPNACLEFLDAHETRAKQFKNKRP